MINEFFVDQRMHYYNRQKNVLCSFVSIGENTIFDLGCGSGTVGRNLLKAGKAKEVIGIEIFPKAAREAGKYYTKVYTGNVEEMDFDYNKYFDYVVCGDILEHLVDPWAMLKKIHRWMKDDGKIIISIPNIRYFRIIRDLFFFGKWEYKNAGILDRTHLRFFTRSSFYSSLKDTDYSVITYQAVIHGNKKKIFNKLTLGSFAELLASQYVFVAQKKMSI